MLDKPLKIEKREAAKYEPLPDGVYQVSLWDIVASEQEVYKKKGEFETVLQFQFICLNPEFRKRSLNANFIPSYLYIGPKAGKNKLYQVLEALLGRILTPEDELAMETDGNKVLNELIGKQCMLMVEVIEKNEKSFNNVMKFLKVSTLLPALTDEERKEIAEWKQKAIENKVANQEVKTEEAFAPASTTDLLLKQQELKDLVVQAGKAVDEFEVLAKKRISEMDSRELTAYINQLKMKLSAKKEEAVEVPQLPPF